MSQATAYNKFLMMILCTMYVDTLQMMSIVTAANSSCMETWVLPSARGLSLSRKWATHSLKVGMRPLR